MRILPDPLLYRDTTHCLARLRALPAVSSKPLPRLRVHLYWIGRFGAKQALAVKSFLSTHDPARAECWLWLDTPATFAGAPANPHLRPFLPFVKLLRFDMAAEVRDSPFEGQDWIARTKVLAQVSDIARLLILYRHGGLYVDMDSLFLRDVDALREWINDADFAYQWGYEPKGNTAYMRLHAGGPAVLELMQAANQARSAHPREVVDFARLSDNVLMLPCPAISPLWLYRDKHDPETRVPYKNFNGFFKRFGWFFKRSPEIATHTDFFPGAFTYHWHNHWKASEHRDSYAGLFDECFNDILREKYPAIGPLHRYGDRVKS